MTKPTIASSTKGLRAVPYHGITSCSMNSHAPAPQGTSSRPMRSNQAIELVGPLEDPPHQRKKRTLDEASCEDSPLTPIKEVSVTQTFDNQFSRITMTLPGSSANPAQAVQATPVVQQHNARGHHELPSRNDKKAPQFDRDSPEELPQYIEDVEECLAIAGIMNIEEKKKAMRKYIDM